MGNSSTTTRPRDIPWTRWVLLGFIVALFLLGGGSRADIASLIVLRPMTVLVLAYTLTQLNRDILRAYVVPLSLLGGLCMYAAMQLVPLPPSIWTALPGRAPIAVALDAADAPLGWRPISVAPMLTLNSVGALLVPFTVLLLFSLSDSWSRQLSVYVFVAFAVLSAAVGLLQGVSGGASEWMYPYRVTNDGLPVGLFANRNHQAAIIAAAIPFVFALAETDSLGSRRSFAWWGSRLLAVGLVVVAVMTGSRTGTLLAFLSLGVSWVMFEVSAQGRNPHRHSRRKLPFAGIGAAIALIGGLGGLLIVKNAGAFSRFSAKQGVDDIRFQILPEVVRMVRDGLPLGWGFGTFPEVYKIYERVELIVPAYINRAHNDWLELVIEGGIVSIALIVGLVIWMGARIWANRKIALRASNVTDFYQLASALALVVLAAASVSDYPLRTPFAATLVALLIGWLAKGPPSRRSTR